MINYPLSFFGAGQAFPGIKSDWTATATNFSYSCSVPKEFEGDGTAASPEDFYLLALQNCFIATFKVFAEYSKLQFEGIKAESELIVDLNEEKKPVMKKIILKVEINKALDEKKARLIVNKTIQNGFILQSVKTEISTEISFT